MSIQKDLDAYTALCEEIQKLKQTIKILGARRAEIEANIKEFLHANQHPGIKFKGRTIFLDRREYKVRQSAANRQQEMLAVLNSNNIQNAEEVLEQLTRRNKFETERLKIK